MRAYPIPSSKHQGARSTRRSTVHTTHPRAIQGCRRTENGPVRDRAALAMCSVPSMPRGHGGRIEEAFAKCKERGEAAFVPFITAGYPAKEGERRDETRAPFCGRCRSSGACTHELLRRTRQFRRGLSFGITNADGQAERGRRPRPGGERGRAASSGERAGDRAVSSQRGRAHLGSCKAQGGRSTADTVVAEAASASDEVVAEASATADEVSAESASTADEALPGLR